MRVGIIGMGWVGSSIAISTLHGGAASELLLCDTRPELCEAEAMDLAHGAPFYPAARVRTASVDEMNDCDAVVISAGRGGGPDETRLDLLLGNARIMRDIGRQLSRCRGVVIVVTNPVDVLTRVLQEASGLPIERVIGTGTMLDTARLRQLLGRELDVDPRAVHAHVVAEHGDSEVVLWSGARVGGKALRAWPGWRHDRESELATTVRRAAYEIIRRKGATNHAIGLVTAALLRWVLRGERRVLTVSRVQTGALGLHGVALSLPTVMSTQGAVDVVEPELDGAERDAVMQSASVLEAAYSGLTAREA